MRLDKYISDAGFGSRKDVKAFINKGLVTVNGTVETDPGLSVGDSNIIVCDGRVVEYCEFYYYMLNKPAGVVTATEDASEKTVMDLFPENRPKGLSPVGRLDKDTVGLLLVTNDGELAHRLLSPKSHVEKEYFVITDRPIDETDNLAFISGMTLSDGTELLPAKLSIEKENPHAAIITIHEGKYHQIKRMFSDRGKKVIFLRRLAMGSLKLDKELPEGQYRKLTPDEISLLKAL